MLTGIVIFIAVLIIIALIVGAINNDELGGMYVICIIFMVLQTIVLVAKINSPTSVTVSEPVFPTVHIESVIVNGNTLSSDTTYIYKFND